MANRNRLNGKRHRPIVPYNETRAARQSQIIELTNKALRDFKIADISPVHQQTSNDSTLELLTFLSNLETLLHLAELSQSALQNDRDRYRRIAKDRLRTIKSLRSQL